MLATKLCSCYIKRVPCRGHVKRNAHFERHLKVLLDLHLRYVFKRPLVVNSHHFFGLTHYP